MGRGGHQEPPAAAVAVRTLRSGKTIVNPLEERLVQAHAAEEAPEAVSPFVRRLQSAPCLTEAQRAGCSLYFNATAAICLLFGALCSLACPLMDRLFRANIGTPEAQLFCRHFGLSLLFTAYFLRFFAQLAGSRGVAKAVVRQASIAALLWNVAVLGAFLVEILALGCFADSLLIARVAMYLGVAGHGVLLAHGVKVYCSLMD